ncbi:Bacterioferritin-associated ferredoxin OS=Castellaniella defragrans OX=75697 GN=HNR28_002173 PE=4 SV=1 [Castellaniella defragrans]
MIIILMYICVCNAVNERQIQEALAHGARDLRDLRAELGVGACCGRCAKAAREYLASQTGLEAQLVAGAPLPDLNTIKVVELSRSPVRRVA